MLWQQPIDPALEKDIPEPAAINVVMEYESKSWNMMSQSTQTLAKVDRRDMLHCAIAG